MRIKSSSVVLIIVSFFLILLIFLLTNLRFNGTSEGKPRTEAETINAVQSFFQPHFDLIVIDTKILEDIDRSLHEVAVSPGASEIEHPDEDLLTRPLSLGLLRNRSFTEDEDFVLQQLCTFMGTFFCTFIQSTRSSRVTHLLLRDEENRLICQISVLRQVSDNTLVIDRLPGAEKTNFTLFGSEGIQLFDTFDLQRALYHSVKISIPVPIDSFLSQSKSSVFVKCRPKSGVKQNIHSESKIGIQRVVVILKLFLKGIEAKQILSLDKETLEDWYSSCGLKQSATGFSLKFSSFPVMLFQEDNNFLTFLQTEGMIYIAKMNQSYVSFSLTSNPAMKVSLSFDGNEKQENLCSTVFYEQRVNVPCDLN